MFNMFLCLDFFFRLLEAEQQNVFTQHSSLKAQLNVFNQNGYNEAIGTEAQQKCKTKMGQILFYLTLESKKGALNLGHASHTSKKKYCFMSLDPTRANI